MPAHSSPRGETESDSTSLAGMEGGSWRVQPDDPESTSDSRKPPSPLALPCDVQTVSPRATTLAKRRSARSGIAGGLSCPHTKPLYSHTSVVEPTTNFPLEIRVTPSALMSGVGCPGTTLR